MIGKFSLFLTSLFYPVLLPHRRQQLIELLEDVCQDICSEPCCQDILELWLEEFGTAGLMLGNVALFGLGLILTIAVDLILHRSGSPILSLILGTVSTLFCLAKFHTRQPAISLLIVLFGLYWLLSGFWWSIAFLFLIYFTNMGLHYGRGGKKC